MAPQIVIQLFVIENDYGRPSFAQRQTLLQSLVSAKFLLVASILSRFRRHSNERTLNASLANAKQC